MIIRQLELHNFGVYSGINTFDFENQKPVVLIGGLNGRGKTTFLEAVLLALYGSSSFLYEESRKATYGLYLRSLINQNDGSMDSYVRMIFHMGNETDEEYTVQRSWNGKGKRIREQIEVWKDGRKDAFLTSNWGMFIENLIPSALSAFFFFDGEKIAELAVEKTNDRMKQSIKALLGIQILDLLEKDLLRVLKAEKNVNGSDDTDNLIQLREREDIQREKTEEITARLNEKKAWVKDLQRELELREEEYKIGGGELLASRQTLHDENSRIKAELDQNNRKKVELAAGELPLLLVPDLLQETLKELQKERNEKDIKTAGNKIRELYMRYQFKGGEDTGEIGNFLKFIDEQPELRQKEDFLEMSEYALMQAEQLCGKQRDKIYQELEETKHKDRQLQKKLADIEQYLMVEIDEKQLDEMYRSLLTRRQDIIEAEVKIQEMESSLEEEQKILRNLEQERRKLADSAVKALETREKSERKRKYIYESLDVIGKYKISLQKMKLGQLERTVTDCYLQLANKRNLIQNIIIDKETLEFTYFSGEGSEIDKESLSAGEKQLMVIAILWGLAICSGKRLPVIIDTPLSRLDSEHRVALIQKYFPNASDQTIILSTDSEIDGRYYDIMKEFVGDEFTLKYDDETKSTTIEQGYFPGVIEQ